MVSGAGMENVKATTLQSMGGLKPKDNLKSDKKKLEITGAKVENPELAGEADAAMRAQVLGVNSDKVVSNVDKASSELTETAFKVIDEGMSGYVGLLEGFDGSIDSMVDLSVKGSKLFRKMLAATKSLEQGQLINEMITNAMFTQSSVA